VVNVADIQIAVNAALACSGGSSTGTSAVAHLAVQSGNGQAACICITATLQAFQPISVKATDIHGNPVSGATVTWSVTSGQMVMGGPTSITDSTGVATQSMSLTVLNNFTSTAVPYLVSTIQASSNNNSVIFTETQSLVTSQGSSVIEANAPLFNGTGLSGVTLSAAIGTTLSTPIQTQIAGLEIASNGVPNVSVRIVNQQSTPTITCTTGAGFADPGSVLSDSQGNTNCYPTFSGSGSGTFTVMIGGVPGADVCNNGSGPVPCYLQQFGPYNFTSMPGAPAAVQIVSGNNQVEPIGQMLSPLVAKLVDASGNAVQGQTMAWSVVPAGAASLVNGSLVTDNNGEVSTTVSLGSLAIAGVTITCALNSNANIAATFHETVPNALTAMNKISGDNQTAPAGTDFANPLVVQLVNSSGPAEGFIVRYQSTGPVLLDGTAADTDANGDASITVTAGSTTGTATVTATAGALSKTFTLTVTAAPPGQPAIANRKR
jgi:adhesin/invasin